MKKEVYGAADMRKRFQQILEYSVPNGGSMLIDEDDDENEGNEQDQEQGDDQNNAPMDDVQGGPDMGGDAMAGGAPDMMDGNAPDMGGAPNPQQGSEANPSSGFNPQSNGDDMMDDIPEMGDNGVGPDDDVIDISELVDSQDDMTDGIESIDKKFSKALKYIDKLVNAISKSDEKIETLRAEIERRNPTPQEKLSMQTANSYPFNTTPNEYWEKKEATSNYSTAPDNNGKEQSQYVITKDDVDGKVDWKNIADSLSDKNDDKFDIFNQTMKSITGI